MKKKCGRVLNRQITKETKLNKDISRKRSQKKRSSKKNKTMFL